MLNPSIFCAYDIRGIVDTALTKEAAYGVGRALASEVFQWWQSHGGGT